MKWRKLNRVLHRDIGYLFFGMSVIYGISGIALNHIDNWDPSYHIRSEKVSLPGLATSPGRSAETGLSIQSAKQILRDLKISNRYKNHYFPVPGNLKIFVEGGTVSIDQASGNGLIEIVTRRPFLFQFNFLHYNNPKFLWTWFADLYGAGLVLMAFTGLWMIQGKRGFSGRGKWYVIAGIFIPLVFLLLYL